MRDVKTIILEPDEYKTQFDLRLLPSGQTIPQKAIIITKDGANTVVPTTLNVDEGCRIELKWSGKGYGRVKHLTSTPRRRYFTALMWFSIILWITGAVLTLYEILVNGNYATADSRTKHAMLTAVVSWMGLVITSTRNGHGFRKWFATIFSYMVMLVSIGSLIIYIVRLIQGEGALF